MKTYFNRSMFILSAAFIIYFLVDIYEEVITLIDLEYSHLFIWQLVSIIKPLLIISLILLFIHFMRIANRNQLFSQTSSRLWTYKSIVLLIVGVISFIELKFQDGTSLYFAMSVFFATFCLAMSNIFKEGTVLKQENDLTI